MLKPLLCRVSIKPKPSCGGPLSLPDPVARPDLRIYSQFYRHSQGLSVSWDSPDITTWLTRNGIAQTRESFLVRVTNDSQVIGADNGIVHCNWSEFGIGTNVYRLASQQVSFSPGAVENLIFPLPESLRIPERFIRAHIEVIHPSDSNLKNNNGDQGVRPIQMKEFEARIFQEQIPVENNTIHNRTLDLELHIQDSPLPATINIKPTQLSLSAGTAGSVTVTVTLDNDLPNNFPPGGPGARFSILALDANNKLIDGVAYAITS